MHRTRKITVEIKTGKYVGPVSDSDFQEIKQELEEKMVELSLMYGFSLEISAENTETTKNFIEYDKLELKHVSDM